MIHSDQEVVFLTRSLPFHAIGGMETQIWDLADELSRRGLKVTIITTPLPKGSTLPEYQKGIEIIFAKTGRPGKYSFQWWYESLRLFNSIKHRNICGVMSVSAAGYLVAYANFNRQSFPLILQIHGTSISEAVSKLRSLKLINILKAVKNIHWIPIDILFMKYFDMIITIGPKVTSSINEGVYRSIKKGEIFEISNGIPTKIFRYSPKFAKVTDDSRTLKIVSASRIHKEKGIAESIEGIIEYSVNHPQDNVEYCIIGDGPDKNRLCENYSNLPENLAIKFLGYKTRYEIYNIYAQSDLFIFTSLRIEGLPLNVLEAISSGLPCIVSDGITDFSEIDSVLTVNPQSRSDISNAIETALTIDFSKELPEEFTLEYSAGKYLELFSKIRDIKKII